MRFRLLDSNDNLSQYMECVKDLNGSGLTLSSIEDMKYSLENRPSNILTFGLLDEDNNILATATIIIEKKLRYQRLCCHIEDVGVHPDHRGKGYGRDIVKYCMDIAKHNNCYKVKLNCNNTLVAFYEKLGFEKMDNGMVLKLS